MARVVKLPRKQGRPPKPARVSAKSTPLPKVPPAPSWLSAEGKTEWRRCAPQLTERKVLTASDLGMLEGYCAAKGRLVAAQFLIDRDGIMIAGKDGVLVKHPATAVAEAASGTMRALAMQLGMTPATRRRVAQDDQSAVGDDRWGDMLE